MNSPQEWRRMTVGDLFDFVNGNGFKPSDWTTEGFPIIRIQNLNGSNNYNYYNGEIRKSWIVDPGQLLFAWAGTRGVSFGPHIWKGPKGVLNQHIYKLMPRIEGDNRWLYYILARVTEKIERKAHGFKSTLLHVQKSDIVNQVVAVPPKCEQKAIADLLSTWDEAIEKTERLIQAKERRFQWLLREIMSDSAKGNLNKGWRKVAIGSFLTESRIPDTVNDPNKRLTVRLHLKGVEAREVRGTESSDATAYFIRKAGQLVYGKQNIFRGAVGIIPPELDGYASTQDIPAFDIDDTVDPDWLLFLFSYPGFYKQLEIYASGSGSKRLHPKDLFKIHVSVPPLEEQKWLADRLSIARTEIDLLKELADRYKSQKRGLMQKLLTGQWRVRMDKEVA